MAEGERIPIVMEEAPPEVPREGIGTVRDDGTLVVDIKAPEPCAPAEDDKIVVCASSAGQEGDAPDDPLQPRAMVLPLAKGVDLVGTAGSESSAMGGSDARVLLTLRIKF